VGILLVNFGAIKLPPVGRRVTRFPVTSSLIDAVRPDPAALVAIQTTVELGTLVVVADG
jgi:hypothetical protein